MCRLRPGAHIIRNSQRPARHARQLAAPPAPEILSRAATRRTRTRHPDPRCSRPWRLRVEPSRKPLQSRSARASCISFRVRAAGASARPQDPDASPIGPRGSCTAPALRASFRGRFPGEAEIALWDFVCVEGCPFAGHTRTRAHARTF